MTTPPVPSRPPRLRRLARRVRSLVRRRTGPQPPVPAGGGPAPPAARPAARRRQLRRRKKFQYVFVVTYGRSGSTLVQGLLNALPRTLVRGENGLYLVHLYRALADAQRFRSRHDKHRGRAPSSAFFGVRHTKLQYFHRAVRGIVKDSVLGPVDPSSVDRLGFKEVQWHRIEPREVAGFFDMMDAAFPGVRYVLNTRNAEAVLKSGFWRRVDDDLAAQRVEAIKEIQQFLRETRPERVLDVAYEAVTAADPAVQDRQLVALGEFVTGEPVPAQLLDTMRATVARPHGPNSTAAAAGPAAQSST